MPPPPRTLVNLHEVAKSFGPREVLRAVRAGVAAEERIGIVGPNGEGKSTLLELIAGREAPDLGAVTAVSGLRVAHLPQGDELGSGPVRGALVGERAEHEWAGRPAFRAVLDGLLGGVALTHLPAGLETPLIGLSGGERRRIALARVLLEEPELLLLDEPTNHLDVEAISWLGRHLVARRGALVVITHDRWFLDAVCTATWEVAEGGIHRYEGGYAAYVLARAERARQAAAREQRRLGLLRKELAWLRRGPPARTSKPKFRIEAANAIIADEPEVRDKVELMRFATARLGNKVLEAEEVSVRAGAREILRGVTLRLGPGDRVAVLGANGSGKTTLLRALAGETAVCAGKVERGATVRLAFLSQGAQELPEGLRVLESLEEVRARVTLSDGSELTAGSLAERFGFRGDRGRTLVGDLSGGERRRLGLMRLLMAGPNVLLLDEPTNDLDLDTLAALEDLLDHWPGTLVVASHDRYFVERVSDNVYGLAGGRLRHLPGGVEQYLGGVGADGEPGGVPGGAGADRSAGGRAAPGGVAPGAAPGTAPGAAPGTAPGAARREARKELRRTETALERLTRGEAALREEMAAKGSDAAALMDLHRQLEELAVRREELETAWLELSEQAEA